MEMATALLSMVGIGGAGATGAGVAGGSSFMTSILQGTLTAFKAAASIGQGMAARNEARIEELGAAAQASREKIAADDEATRISRALAETIGEQSIAYAAAGIDLGSGTPAQARAEAQKRANEDLSINRSNRNAKVAAWNQRALAARSRGRSAMMAGFMNGGADIAGFGLDLADRGGPFKPRRA